MESDAELLHAWASGAVEAGDAFIKRYFDLLWRYFRNKVDGDTEDLVQNTLAACVKHREKLGVADDVRAYVLMIARNELLMHLRRAYKRPQAIDPAEVSIYDLSPSPSTVVAKRAEQQRLLDALRQLPLELQEVLELYYWEGLRSPELARLLATPEPTIRRRLQRARTQLRDRLEGLDDDALDALGASITPKPSHE